MALSHNFEVHTLKSPHFCDFCGEFIWGLVRQGIKCSNCGMNVHKRCGAKVGNECRPRNNSQGQGEQGGGSSSNGRSSLNAPMSGVEEDVPNVSLLLIFQFVNS